MGSGQQDADEAAITWSILLRDCPGDADVQRRFRQWHDAAPGHRRAWSELVQLDARLDRVEPAFAVRPEQVAVAAPRRPVWRMGWASRSVLVGAAVAACLAMLIAPAVLLRLRADYRSDVGEVRHVILADGSTVDLAPLSAIAVDYGGGRRDVRLLKGEAFFKVARNPARPFHVVGDRQTVTVLGTAFDVREAEDAAHPAYVEVEHGRVRVAAQGGASDLLVGGQALAVDRTGGLYRHAVRPAEVAVWRNRQMVVQDQSVTDAIDRLRPWYAGVIITHGKALPDQRLTGVFNLSDPVEALRGMARAYGGRVTVIGDWLILYSQD